MHNSDFSKIEHDAKGDVVTIHLKGAIQDDNTLKSELLHLAAHAADTGVKKVLIKNEDLAHPVSADLQQWARLSVELPLLAGGVDKIAVVMPSTKRMFSLIHAGDTERKRYFDSEDAARAWLAS